ncbi:RAMP superfamily CRISPR-associated protein [Caldisericum sp. AR60]|uniref:RAMP superfamily CRISPR-associated protein n=1 Tax=Caldisericum sp. AR60 TaxID=3397852 RepID=UPI0039FD2867
MGKKEINVDLRTITPLWTGDAWQKNTKIRPSSLMGSLRFWFEVICYFAGVVSKKDFDSKKGRFERDVNEKEFKKNLDNKNTDIKSQIKTLKGMSIPVPSIVFGTTGWRSLIEIREIKPLEDDSFGNRLNLPNRICVSKVNGEVKENSDCPKGSDEKNWSVFYLPNPYFYGQFNVKFLVEEEILNGIFYPLLNFMDEYGYWGGKWNIGYGRLKIIEVKQNNSVKNDWTNNNKFNCSFEDNKNEEFKLSESVNNFSDLIVINNNKEFKLSESVNNFSDLIVINNNDKKIKILPDKVQNQDLKEVIKELIKRKAEERAQNKNNGGDTEKRHKIFGTTEKPPEKEDLPQGSKILPYIKENEENKNYVGGFLSIVDLLELYEGGERDA